jgi:hypothetical protein
LAAMRSKRSKNMKELSHRRKETLVEPHTRTQAIVDLALYDGANSM